MLTRCLCPPESCIGYFLRCSFSPNFSAQNCTACHSTQSFSERIDFDHSKINYPLVGEHTKLKCAECHKPSAMSLNLKWPNFKSKDHTQVKVFNTGKFLFPEVKQQKCIACHTDYHKGQLSNNCSECHSEKGWKPTNFVHDTQSRFKLNGSHATVECLKCHVPTKEIVNYKNQNRFVIKFKPLKTNCIDCHSDPE